MKDAFESWWRGCIRVVCLVTKRILDSFQRNFKPGGSLGVFARRPFAEGGSGSQARRNHFPGPTKLS
jgi:hypothetical protein